MAKKPEVILTKFNEKQHKRATIAMWLLGLFPLYFLFFLIMFQSDDDMPPVSMLDNPPELLASVIYCDDGVTELGKFWQINRSSVAYNKINKDVFDALISTEDERYLNHSGVDFRAVGRAIVNIGGKGGASTITQQLAKLLFTVQERERKELAESLGQEMDGGSSTKIGRKWDRLNEKARENIIATRLEARFTKEEIITMYLNQFDFLHNAVGISNASKVYFNKTPKMLTPDEAAMLVGMCKNPTIYNPYSFKTRNYRGIIAENLGVKLNQVSLTQIIELRSKDSIRAVERRNQVLHQWWKNSEKGNSSLNRKLTREEYDRLCKVPLKTDYQKVDHKVGKAPYFREELRKEVTNLLATKDNDGNFMYAREDGSPYDIYSDGIKIYTTINNELQEHAEFALEEHLKKTLQRNFNRNNQGLRNWPFSNSLEDEQVQKTMNTAMKRSDRWIFGAANGLTAEELKKSFYKPVAMKVFTWKGDKDTVMTPYDSIRFYKSFLQAGLVSVEPSTGFVKAWVGGADYEHFAYDHVRLGTRQVGSTIKPFIYACGIQTNVIKPSMSIPSVQYCVDLINPNNGRREGSWCPSNSGGGMGGSVTISRGLANSMNNVAAYIMKQMGAVAGPKIVEKMLAKMDIKLNPNDVVPSMCLGSMDLSLLQLVGAQATFANGGIYNRPTTILRIEDRSGKIIYSAKSNTVEVMNENIAYAIIKMMKGVVEGGTASSLRYGSEWGNITYPTAGKTGTTQNNSDGWFVGMTPNLATGVWVGAEDRGVRFQSTGDGQGARVALPIYGYYMNKVYKDAKLGYSTLDFDKPKDFDESLFEVNGWEEQSVPSPSDTAEEVHL